MVAGQAKRVMIRIRRKSIKIGHQLVCVHFQLPTLEVLRVAEAAESNQTPICHLLQQAHLFIVDCG